MNAVQIASLGEGVFQHREQIAKEIGEFLRFSRHGLESEEVMNIRSNFIGLVGQAMSKYERDEALEEISRWGKEIGTFSAEKELPLDEALQFLPHYREAVFRFIQKEIGGEQLSFDCYREIESSVNTAIDEAVYTFSKAYVDYNRKAAELTRQEILELSVPIVPLTSDVAVLTLIGTLDACRAQQLMEKTMQTGSELGLAYLIVDLSGVYQMDNVVSRSIQQLHQALKLLGITVILSGMRPELAQQIVTMRISLKSLRVTRSLPEAMLSIGLKIDVNK
ncbi:STAS domain-containing protein [Sinobaca sp. H24]|uniref:STAS domain-containing protein n=1 Tax=Sinobaca sp. H24 TaxID=2923376 RepID=UPI00207AD655|nr:STAS domain-containing protein [Sinobaca sp. H24]